MASSHPHDRPHDHGHDHSHASAPPGAPLDPASESLSQALRSAFRVLRILMVVLLVAYFLSGWFRVGPGEQGLIVRFGKLRTNTQTGSHVFGPGSHAALPDPLDEKIPISGATRSVRVDTFHFRGEGDREGTAPAMTTIDPATQGTLLTGDRNLAHARFHVNYRVADAGAFVMSVGEMPEHAEALIRRLAENAVLRTISSLPIETVLRRSVDAASADFIGEVQRRLTDSLTRLKTGIEVDQIVAETFEPGYARDYFVQVTNAASEREKSVQEAQGTAQRILTTTVGEKHETIIAAIEAYGAAQSTGAEPGELRELRSRIDELLRSAGGEVAVKLRDASTAANARIQKLRSEYEDFQALRASFQKFPELTVGRIWLQMRSTVLGSRENEIFYVPESGPLEIIVNRDPVRIEEIEAERLRDRSRKP